MNIKRRLATTPDMHGSPSLEQRLFLEEKRLAESMLRRTRLLGEIAADRARGKRPGPNPDLEKNLWRIWEDVLVGNGCDQLRHWRRLQAQCNSLAYALADGHAGASEGRTSRALKPVPSAKPVQMSGPADVLVARTLTYWAALGNVQMRLGEPVLNDGLVELIKALNQAGAGLSWDKDAVSSTVRSGSGLHLDQKSIHAGRHQSTLALMLAFALGSPGVVKFSGTGALSMLSLANWQKVCSQLGARLRQLNPHAPGLPARLESSGQVEAVFLDQDAPRELVWGLLAAAPFYPAGLRLSWADNFSPCLTFKSLVSLLQSCAVPVISDKGGLFIHPVSPVIPQQPEPPLDPDICALLLAWSRFSGQAVTITGSWPKEAPAAQVYDVLLASCGLKIDVDRGSITASVHGRPKHPVFDVSSLPRAVPLATVLAGSAPGDSVVVTEQDLQDITVMDKLLRFTGRSLQRDGPRHHFRLHGPGPDLDAPVLEAPDARWGMALALLSFACPGLALANPGVLTTLWPRFWHVFHEVLSVPRPKPEPQPVEIVHDQPARQRRRVRI